MKDKIGRSIEMTEILKYLESRENRLVTIVGIPGLLKQDLSDLIAQHVYQRDKYANGVVNIRVG